MNKIQSETRRPSRCFDWSASRRDSARSLLSTTSTSMSPKASQSLCSGRAARARRPCSASSPDSTHPTPVSYSCAVATSSLAPAERNIGVVFQHYALFPHLSVVDNVAYGLKMRQWKRSARLARAREMLAMVRLAGYEDRLPRQLSGGQQQRVALARALAFEPTLLLLDEPLGALDRAIRGQMQTEIRRIHRELGTTMVHVTHDKEEALALGDRIAIMRNGRIAAADTPIGLHLRPTSSFVAEFFCGYNLLPVEVIDTTDTGTATISWFGDRIDVPSSESCERGSAMLAIPPGEVTFVDDAGPDTLSMKAVIVDVLYLGDVTEVTAEVSGLGLVVARVRAGHELGMHPEDTVTVNVPIAKTVLVPNDTSPIR